MGSRGEFNIFQTLSHVVSKDYSYTKYVNQEYITELGEKIKLYYPEFNTDDLIEAVVPKLEKLNFTKRMRLISDVLHQMLPDSYPKALDILIKTLGPELTKETGTFNDGYIYWPISCFIEDYGQNNFIESMDGMYELTKRFTAEYAVRSFLINDFDKTLDYLMTWIDDPNAHVRRLVSEGTRPTIPWGKKIPRLIQDPSPTLPVLEALKADPSKYVQKSVANHLNAISKTHPDLVIDLVSNWKMTEEKSTKWIIKQALRTLVKQEDERAIEIVAEIKK